MSDNILALRNDFCALKNKINLLQSNELQWLLGAADHLIKVGRGEAAVDDPVAVNIPETATRDPQADNTIRVSLEEYDYNCYPERAETCITILRIHLGNLEEYFGREGTATIVESTRLHRGIAWCYKEIIGTLKELAEIMREVYGIHVYQFAPEITSKMGTNEVRSRVEEFDFVIKVFTTLKDVESA